MLSNIQADGWPKKHHPPSHGRHRAPPHPTAFRVPPPHPQEFLAKDTTLDDLVSILAKANIANRLMDFAPPNKRTPHEYHLVLKVRHGAGRHACGCGSGGVQAGAAACGPNDTVWRAARREGGEVGQQMRCSTAPSLPPHDLTLHPIYTRALAGRWPELAGGVGRAARD
mgnify:CR=1 FL=1